MASSRSAQVGVAGGRLPTDLERLAWRLTARSWRAARAANPGRGTPRARAVSLTMRRRRLVAARPSLEPRRAHERVREIEPRVAAPVQLDARPNDAAPAAAGSAPPLKERSLRTGSRVLSLQITPPARAGKTDLPSPSVQRGAHTSPPDAPSSSNPEVEMCGPRGGSAVSHLYYTRALVGATKPPVSPSPGVSSFLAATLIRGQSSWLAPAPILHCCHGATLPAVRRPRRRTAWAKAIRGLLVWGCCWGEFGGTLRPPPFRRPRTCARGLRV